MKIPSGGNVCPYCGADTFSGRARKAFRGSVRSADPKRETEIHNISIQEISLNVGLVSGFILMWVLFNMNHPIDFIISIVSIIIGAILSIALFGVTMDTFLSTHPFTVEIGFFHPTAIATFFYGLLPMLFLKLLFY